MAAKPSEADPLGQGLEGLRGATPYRRELLEKLGVRTVGDLLFHFPRAYQDLTDRRKIDQLEAGRVQTVEGEVVEIESRQTAEGRPVVSIVLHDGGREILEGVWFGQLSMARRFRFGMRAAFSGKVTRYQGRWQMTSPRVTVPGEEGDEPPGVVPVYPLTEDLRAEGLRRLLRQAVDRCGRFVPEVLPAVLKERHRLANPEQALRQVHFPATLAEADAGRRRFVYEEFLLLQLGLALRRRDLRDRQRAPRLPATPLIDARIRRLFPFPLTADQDRAVAEVCRDLAGERPMQRLLQADVGAGKTAVAVYALLVTVANKHQAAIMAPTEVLARQHWETLQGYLAQSRVRRLLLTGALTPKQRREGLAGLAAGEVDLVVGTQALVQEDVRFARLGLVVIDEQHKFGVSQRARFRRLAVDPHYLVMTATPIPRTMALTVFGDLDVSVIRQLPPGRQPVLSRWVQPDHRARLYARLREELRQGRQGYFVCPLVEESEVLDLKAATAAHEQLQREAFAEFRLGLLHGRMDEEQKAEVMGRFRRREVDLLVCTSVVEVGVDVPNATLMVVEHAERFGLSQLHQLRGRVSRGEAAGQCYLFADPASEEARERLLAFVRLRDGFALAEEDARLRGAGQFFGTRQHGLGELRLADLARDRGVLQQARKDAIALVAEDAGLRRPEHAALRQAVLAKYGRTLDLAEVG